MASGNVRLETAMRMMRLMNIDTGILTETWKAEGYDIISTKAKSSHQGGVAIFYRSSNNWHIEGTKEYGHNVKLAELVSGKKRWILVGAYIPPSEEDGTTLDHIQAATTSTTKHP
jgi:exonuclease III